MPKFPLADIEKVLEEYPIFLGKNKNLLKSKNKVNNLRFYKNGLSEYTKKLKVKVFNDEKNCRLLWNTFSPNISIFDLWDFRYPFYKNTERLKLYFIAFFKEDEIVGVLPLNYDIKYKYYRWFGTGWHEDNKFFVSDPYYIPLLLDLAPPSTRLYCIEPGQVEKIIDMVKFKKDDSKYTLSLNNISNYLDYLKLLKKKKRYNLKRDVRHIEQYNPELSFNNLDDYEVIKDLLGRRFKSKGELADWQEEPSIIDVFRDIATYKGRTFSPRIVSVRINNTLAAVDLVATYKGTYYALRGAADIQRYPGLGNYMNLIELNDAKSLGCQKIDFLQVDYNWKKSLLNEVPLLMFENNKS